MPRAGYSAELHRDAWHQLYLRGYKPRRVYRVESAGESLTGDTTVIFQNSDREAMTAFFASQEVPKKKSSDPEEYRLHIIVIPGWPVEIGA